MFFLFCFFTDKLSDCSNVLCVQLVLFARDTAGQERFKTITTAYYRGAMVRQETQMLTNLNFLVLK